MDTRPKVTRFELDRCIGLIAARRSKADDRNLELMPDDPAGVLDYLRKYSGPDIPRHVRQADVLDALTLNNWLWWEDRRRELWALRQGKLLGHYLSTLGAQLGVRTRQGTADRIDRLEALLQFDRPDEKLTRAARREALLADAARDVELAWIRRHTGELREVVAGMVEAAERYELNDDEREWLDELVTDVQDDAFTPGLMAVLGMAASDLRTAPAVLALDGPRPHKVHQVLAHAERLRTEFAELGKRTGVDR